MSPEEWRELCAATLRATYAGAGTPDAGMDGESLVEALLGTGRDIAVITEAPERIWVWSDLHLGDQTAHRIWNRPEASARALSERMLQEWERSVGAHDLMLCLGDVAHPFLLTDMEATARIRAAPGRRVLVVGNHDVHRRRMLVRAGFDDMYVAAVHAGEPRLVFSHPPLPSIPGGGINVHGHLHRRSAPSPRHWNVSVERLGYRPVRLDRLIAENRNGPLTTACRSRHTGAVGTTPPRSDAMVERREQRQLARTAVAGTTWITKDTGWSNT